jgi:hypothetical protein
MPLPDASRGQLPVAVKRLRRIAVMNTRALSGPRFPEGRNEKRVLELIAEPEARMDEVWLAADEGAAADRSDQAVISLREALLLQIRCLLAAHHSALAVNGKNRATVKRPRAVS